MMGTLKPFLILVTVAPLPLPLSAAAQPAKPGILAVDFQSDPARAGWELLQFSWGQTPAKGGWGRLVKPVFCHFRGSPLNVSLNVNSLGFNSHPGPASILYFVNTL